MSLTGKIFESVPTRGKAKSPSARKASVVSRVASALLLTGALGLTACTRDYTVAYLYATGGSGINQYGVNYRSGALVPIAGSPVAAGNNPIKIIASPNGLNVYVLNQGDSTVQLFSVDPDSGKLTSKNTPYPTGSHPTSMAMDPAGKFLYVTFTYQTGYSAANPGPGGVNIFPISSDFSLGSPTTQPLGNNPVDVTVTNFTPFVYIIDAEPAVGTGSPLGWLLAFSQNTSNGALTPIGRTNITVDSTGKSVATGYGAGTNPSAIAADPTARWVYVTDRSTNQLYGNIVIGGGLLQPMQNSPFATGLLPVGVVVDPRGRYMYVSNFNDNTVSAYAIDQSTGSPVGSVGSGATKVGTGPTCLTIEPALGIYLYTSNNLDNTTSGLKLDAHTGALQNVQNTPFPAAGTPTCVVAVGNGSHATQVVNP